jgi:S-adenosylmethionine:tRNA ribosyltransferase-isomerase
LEYVYLNSIFKGTTDLFITKGFKFNIADYLITNFHAPKSTLISIVYAMYGDNWRELYKYALEQDLKFLSFGDAVLFKVKNK